ncbi:MAG TPA: FAD-binding oxidoreductase, partial [Bdellovibrionales bacterium]|nr:FAD-binding oxidoreductase [Bdellovibrionales bacterium]
TGLSGAATATKGEVIVSFQKMNRILEFSDVDSSVWIEPGVITEDLQNFAKDKGLYFPIDFAARGSSQVGGNIATNAGGIHVLRYGLTRDWVMSLEVVTGTGEVLKLNQGLIKNATGYDLRHLMIGSEGTLGFVTKAEMRLCPPPKETMVFLFAVDSLASIMEVFKSFRKNLSLIAFEMFTQEALSLVVESESSRKAPFDSEYPYYLVVEGEKDSVDAEDRALALFEECVEKGLIVDGVLAQSPQQAKELWSYREDISECATPFSPYKNDISVRISKVPGFLESTESLLKKEYPDLRVVWFGHIGDGNLHINILKPESMDKTEFLSKCAHASELLFQSLQKFEGSISAEHGVGIVKKPYLEFTRSKAEVEIFRGIKKSFDPDGILNPGKIFDL